MGSAGVGGRDQQDGKRGHTPGLLIGIVHALGNMDSAGSKAHSLQCHQSSELRIQKGPGLVLDRLKSDASIICNLQPYALGFMPVELFESCFASAPR